MGNESSSLRESCSSIESSPCAHSTKSLERLSTDIDISVYRQSMLTPVHKEDSLTQMLNSASNFWLNFKDMSLFGPHRKVSKYSLDKSVKILQINDAIVTEDELRAAKKIEIFFLEYMRKKPIPHAPHCHIPAKYRP